MLLLLLSGWPARWLRAASLALVALLSGPAWAQTAPPRPTVKTGSWPPIPRPVYFVDGQRIDSAAFAALKPDDITDLKVVKGAAARALDANATGRGLIAITTKQQQQNAKVVAFNQQIEQVLKEHRSPSEATIQAENAVQPADVRYYLNGQLSTRVVLDKLDSHTVTGVRTLRGQRAADYTHDAGAAEVFLITTRPQPGAGPPSPRP